MQCERGLTYQLTGVCQRLPKDSRADPRPVERELGITAPERRNDEV
jgi:hypothetical protein